MSERMIFKKVVDGVPGILRVSIRDIGPGETPKQTLDGEEERNVGCDGAVNAGERAAEAEKEPPLGRNAWEGTGRVVGTKALLPTRPV